MDYIARDGSIYGRFMSLHQYSSESKNCIEKTVGQLLEVATTADRPGMLLGKIQSGKTKTFFGIVALAFDNGYEVAIILTKGTIALTQQTYERLRKDFNEFVDNDEIQIYDVMHMPTNLTQYEMNQKLIIVCKKEDDNLRRLETSLFQTHSSLAQRRILIIDDEADFASVGFSISRDEGIKINKISQQIDTLRKKLVKSSFLQVTATPYSLYLQPKEPKIEITGEFFKPIRPAFTELVPIHEKYIGGEYYFEESEKQGSVASFLHQPVTQQELGILKKGDRRVFKIEDVLYSVAIQSLRNAIVNFIVGGCILRLQSREKGERLKKYSFIVHTERSKQTHSWQVDIVSALLEKLNTAIASDSVLFECLIKDSYTNLSQSIRIIGCFLPEYKHVLNEVKATLPSVNIDKVNSEADIKVLLDESGQLKLRTPLNIFIGGQILDRGLTITNLIGFFYGRNPDRFQQDTVLQHSRMYGARPIEDLAVTRFYTTAQIYQVMKSIHEFDSALRSEFESGGHDAGVVFIQKDEQSRIIPCSPNKIVLSSITTLRPHKRMLPVGFQTGYKTNIYKTIQDIDSIITHLQGDSTSTAPFLIDVEDAKKLIDMINTTLNFEEDGYNWNIDAFKASMEYLARATRNVGENGKVWCLVRRDRDIVRVRPGGRFQDRPDTPHVEGKIADAYAQNIPMLMLFLQNGKKEPQGWRDCPFWWPVLYMPRHMQTVVFASDVDKDTPSHVSS